MIPFVVDSGIFKGGDEINERLSLRVTWSILIFFSPYAPLTAKKKEVLH